MGAFECSERCCATLTIAEAERTYERELGFWFVLNPAVGSTGSASLRHGWQPFYSRDNPQMTTGENIRVLPAFLQDRREVLVIGSPRSIQDKVLMSIFEIAPFMPKLSAL